jgi:hypothetical protein
MSQFVPFTTFGLQTVNSVGAVVRGPLYLQNNPAAGSRVPGGIVMISGVGYPAGLTLGRGDFAYIPDLIGPVTQADWSKVPILNGYRCMVELDFSEIDFDNTKSSGTYGYGLLLNFYADALRPAPTFAPLQINVYGGSGFAAGWRGMYPTVPWKPVWVSGKQPTAAMTMKLTFESRAILTDMTAPGNDPTLLQW